MLGCGHITWEKGKVDLDGVKKKEEREGTKKKYGAGKTYLTKN